MTSHRTWLGVMTASFLVACGTTKSSGSNQCQATGDQCFASPPSTAASSEIGCRVTLATGLTSPAGVAADANNVYWTTGDGYVMSVPLCGGRSVTLASGQTRPQAVVVDATSIYWTDLGNASAGTSVPPGTIMRAPLHGGMPQTLAKEQKSPYSLVTDGTNLYWSNSGTSGGAHQDGSVVKMPISGGTPTTLADNQFGPTSLAMDTSNLYWVNQATGLGGSTMGTISKIPIAGGGVTTLASTSDHIATAIAVDATNVYWGDVTSQVVNRTPLAGGETQKMTGDMQAFVYGINDMTLKGTNLFWVSPHPPPSILSVPTGGTAPVSMPPAATTAGDMSQQIISDANSVYWTDNGSIVRFIPR